jgi:hypothetical protein
VPLLVLLQATLVRRGGHLTVAKALGSTSILKKPNKKLFAHAMSFTITQRRPTRPDRLTRRQRKLALGVQIISSSQSQQCGVQYHLTELQMSTRFAATKSSTTIVAATVTQKPRQCLKNSEQRHMCVVRDGRTTPAHGTHGENDGV